MAWREEFWPPCAAEAAVTQLQALLRRCAWLGTPLQRRAYMEAVPKVRDHMDPPPHPPSTHAVTGTATGRRRLSCDCRCRSPRQTSVPQSVHPRRAM
jgi:hypothetical protein